MAVDGGAERVQCVRPGNHDRSVRDHRSDRCRSGSGTRRVHLRAGYNTYVPFAMKGPDGKPRGLAVEIVNRAAARAGIDLTWVAVSDNVDDELRRGHIDVETCGQLDADIKMGCDTAQGYYLGRPHLPFQPRTVWSYSSTSGYPERRKRKVRRALPR